MGGAQRNQRKRKQQSSAQAARAVAAARGKNSTRNKTIAGAVVVVVIAAAVIAGVLVTNHNKQEQRNAVIPVAQSSHEYPAKLVGNGIVLAGKQNAPVTIDMYEDFICPVCGEFFKASHSDIGKALASGKIKARIHMLGFLDRNSNPAGYSHRAANAALAAAKHGKFADYYSSLYKKQPEEGSAGYTNAQLISLGQRMGLGDQFANAVNNGKYNDKVQQDTKKFASVVSGFYGKKYGDKYSQYAATPTVMYKGKALDLGLRKNRKTGEIVDGPWLKHLLNGKVDVAPKPQLPS